MAAPARNQDSFVLDMATSAVALGKVGNYFTLDVNEHDRCSEFMLEICFTIRSDWHQRIITGQTEELFEMKLVVNEYTGQELSVQQFV